MAAASRSPTCLSGPKRVPSMEVRVDSFVEDLRGEQRLINRAYLVLVALDQVGKPAAVPRLIPETEEECRE